MESNQWSRRQAELFIATQAALIQSDEQSAYTPIELNQKITSLLKSNPDLAEAVCCLRFVISVVFRSHLIKSC